MLKQPQYDPMPIEKQVAVIFAVNNGYLDDVEVNDVRKWEDEFLSFVEARHPEVLQRIRTEKTLSDELEADLKKAIEEFKALQ